MGGCVASRGRVACQCAALTALLACCWRRRPRDFARVDPKRAVETMRCTNNVCRTQQQQHGRSDAGAHRCRSEAGGAEHGRYAVLKDANGPTQYLLLPTARIVGIESPALQAPDAINYFAAAWDARRFVEEALGHDLPGDRVGLAVNSVLARTQNQLHIHIDCIRADVRATLARLQSEYRHELGAARRARSTDHPYQATRVMGPSARRP